ncbi:MAG: hypothetical protein RI897_3405 [Verrucomicrobiota bacterium]
MDDEVPDIGDPGEGVGEGKDGVAAVEEGVGEEQAGANEAEPPEGYGDDDLAFFFCGVPLDEEAGEEDGIAEHADEFPGVPFDPEEVAVEGEGITQPVHGGSG